MNHRKIARLSVCSLVVLLAAWIGSAAAQDATSAPGQNGTLVSITQILETPNSYYYEIVYWSDGLRVTGYMGRPKGDGPFPAVIFNRGGYLNTGSLKGFEIAPFVETGYVAAASNYRGNRHSDGWEHFGGADVDDVMSLILLLKQQPEVDPSRIGMVGASRGGMMTYLALKQDTLNGTHDIKVAVTVGGLADLFMWNQQRGDVLSLIYLPLIGASPANAPQLYQDRSATYWPDLINAPLLLLHGEADAQVAVSQSQALAADLTQAGKTVKLITYPGDDHALSNHIAGYPEMLDWLAQYLGQPDEDRSYYTHSDRINAVYTWFVVTYSPSF